MFCSEITPLSPASLSSLGSPSACIKRKQPSEVPPSSIPMEGAGEISSVQKKPKNTQPAATEVQTHNAMMSYIEREWALAAARNGGENAYGAYMASIGQLSKAGQPPPQQPIASKSPSIASFQQQQVHYENEVDEEEVDEDEQQEFKPLTKAKRNKEEAKDLIAMIHLVQIDDDEDEIYDSCPEVAQKINQFLALAGVNKKIFLEYAMDQKGGYVLLKEFIDGSNQSQCGNKIYGKAYVFFEKLRILEGRDKSERRLLNESLFPYGISTKKPDAQIGSHDLFQEEADPCEDSDEMDEEDSETDLQCYDHFA